MDLENKKRERIIKEYDLRDSEETSEEQSWFLSESKSKS